MRHPAPADTGLQHSQGERGSESATSTGRHVSANCYGFSWQRDKRLNVVVVVMDIR